jgi:peptide/nickel transport system substrate-binding protein/oligopeptide transport system substrate-binding protein
LIREGIVRLRFVIVLLFLFIVPACTTENRLPGYVYYRLGSDPTTLDPALIVDVSGGAIAAKLFNGLLRLGRGLEVEPDLAHTWKVSKNGRKYRFLIREGVKFSSGREVVAADFKYSFERVLDPETLSPKTWIFEKVVGAREFMEGKDDEVKGIRVLDNYTLEIKLTEPFSPFPNLLTMPAAYVVPMEEVLHWGQDFSSHPVGTGPYVLKEWLPNRRLVLKKRGEYFERPARVNGIVYRVIPEELTSVAEFELGNLDVITIPASEYLRYRESEEWSGLISSMEGLNTYYLGLNNQRPPFDNVLLRRAVSYAIDRKRILNTLYEGRGRLARGPVPHALRRWPAPRLYGFEPGMARKMIRDGRAEGAVVNFYITADQQVVDVAEVIQSYLIDAGLDVRLKQLEWSAFKEAINRGEPDMFWLSWWADYSDPENFLFPLFHSSNHGSGGNRVRYTNEEVDSLIEKGQHAITGELRNKHYAKAEEIIANDAPWVFFWHMADFTLRQPWVGNYGLYPVYSMDKGLDIAFRKRSN